VTSAAREIPASGVEGDLASRLSRRLYPFQSRYLTLPGVGRIHYLDEGQGPPIVLLHGNPTWSLLYRNIVPRLAPDFRCVAPDLPGFGLSRAADGFDFHPSSQSRALEAFVQHLGLKGLLMMVHDWGGPIGLGFAARRPDLFSGLVIGNSFAWPVRGQLKYELFSRVVGGRMGRRLVDRHNAYLRLRLPTMSRRKMPDEILALYRAPFEENDTRWLTSYMPQQIIKATDYLEEVERGLGSLRDLRTLILWGASDFSFGPVDRRRFEALFPRHETVKLKGASHLIQEDAPWRIADAIRCFFGEPGMGATHPDSAA